MPRLGLRSAGRKVFASASALSDDLLVKEETCFAEIDNVFGRAAVAGEREVRASFRALKDDPKRVTSSAALKTRLTRLFALAVTGCREPVFDLASDALAMGLEAISVELETIEATMAARFAGAADAGVAGAAGALTGVVEAGMQVYTGQEAAERDVFATLLRQQMGYARKEDADALVARLFSWTPLSRPGNGGRGVFVRSTSGLQAAARAVSIGLTNSVRQAAMEGMNSVLSQRNS